MQIFIKNFFTKKTEMIFIFDLEIKNYINGLDLSYNYVFYTDEIKAKNNKFYNYVKSVDFIKKITYQEFKIAKMILLKKRCETYGSTWVDDMARADAIILEIKNNLKKYNETKNKKYWDAVVDVDIF